MVSVDRRPLDWTMHGVKNVTLTTLSPFSRKGDSVRNHGIGIIYQYCVVLFNKVE